MKKKAFIYFFILASVCFKPLFGSSKATQYNNAVEWKKWIKIYPPSAKAKELSFQYSFPSSDIKKIMKTIYGIRGKSCLMITGMYSFWIVNGNDSLKSILKAISLKRGAAKDRVRESFKIRYVFVWMKIPFT